MNEVRAAHRRRDDRNTMARRETPTPTVGIGASAGGIDALERLFRHVPADTGLAFVVVTHLSPDRESLLPEILRRFTSMPVEPVQDGARLAADHVYVLPENAIVRLEHGVFQLTTLEGGRRERRPVDIFLSALAKDLGECAAGIILSGGDGDGTLGVKAIKQQGGLTMAQTADGAGPAHSGMPQSAIASGMIDFAVPVERMGDELVRFARSLSALQAGGSGAEKDGEDALAAAAPDIYRLLRSQIGHDFSGYKTKTFNRRVQRRMQVLGLDTIDGYLERLRQDPREVSALFRDLLINVTNFFRDTEAFDALAKLVIPHLFENKGAEHTVRVWVPGCATGEEVYSIAILMREHMDGLRGAPRVQIFATDIDDRSLAVARSARYPEAFLDGVSAERRQRFFTHDGGALVVAKEVRDLCIFSPHSIIRDPPFSRMDLVSCRNLLIYFGAQIQDQVIPTIRYALRPNGFLFLGISENVSQHSDLFAPVDKSRRIFRARDDGRVRLPVPLAVAPRTIVPSGAAESGRSHPAPLRQSVEAQMMERFAPAHVVVNAEGDVVYYSARTGKYLEAAAGAPSRSVVAMARKGLRLELRSALREAVETRAPVVHENLSLETEDDKIQLVTLSAEPMSERGGADRLFLVAFQDTGPLLSADEAVSRAVGKPDEAVADLERELRETRDRLQSLVEEYETALEELKSSNEELVSVNEELQSTNEEMEASKEELQSLNEELQTVNLELGHKIDALDRANNDLNNLFESTQIATIFLDEQLRIRTFTPSITELFSILPSDRGRPLTDFSVRLNYPDLLADVSRCMGSGVPLERNVTSGDGRRHFLTSMRPYRSSDGSTVGVVATFVDVTSLTEAEAHQKVLIAELNHRVKNMLAIAVALTRQTAKGAQSVPAFTESLVARLESMARAYELLSREAWTAARVDDLVTQELAAFQSHQVEVEGPEVTAPPKQALSLAMIVHELATNAVKYGALSAGAGKISVGWRLTQGETGQRLRLDWRESGGPPPRAPHRNGFGLNLVERETVHGLGGSARIELEPEGLSATIEIPLP
jgi:two-component system CheB/CheR fusion protein